MTIILTCNAGSHNTKLAAYDAETLRSKDKIQTSCDQQIRDWLQRIGNEQVVAIGHRVVHGGRDFRQPEVITQVVINKLNTLIPLAPLHQPAALRLIEAIYSMYPDMLQIACFDTAFHCTIPDIERRLPLPRALHDSGVMRYGFHGLSYQYIATQLSEHTKGRVVVAHLGGGSSACAMQSNVSIATTMGFSTLDGLMMGTRPGVLDAGVILHLLQSRKMTPQEISDMLYEQSGLKGVSGISGDMRELTTSTHPASKEAVMLYCYLAAKQIAGLIPALGGLDALVFTGGIGENQPQVREHITEYLRWIGDFKVDVIPTDEESVIATACFDQRKKHQPI